MSRVQWRSSERELPGDLDRMPADVDTSQGPLYWHPSPPGPVIAWILSELHLLTPKVMEIYQGHTGWYEVCDSWPKWNLRVPCDLSTNHYSANSLNSLSVSPLYENQYHHEP